MNQDARSSWDEVRRELAPVGSFVSGIGMIAVVAAIVTGEMLPAIHHNPASTLWYVVMWGTLVLAVVFFWPLVGVYFLVANAWVRYGAGAGIVMAAVFEFASYLTRGDPFSLLAMVASLFRKPPPPPPPPRNGSQPGRVTQVPPQQRPQPRPPEPGAAGRAVEVVGQGSTQVVSLPPPYATNRPGRIRVVGQDPSEAFKELVGVDEAITALRDALEIPLMHPEAKAEYKITPSKGILLVGPPGTGKTSLARAAAKHFGCAFIAVNASEFMGPFTGSSEQALRNIFGHARLNKPAIIFFDEIDSIGRKRDGSHINRPSDIALNVLLAEMDGFTPNDGVLVLAATNRPDVLDEALLRPGRFDRIVEMPLPGFEARVKLFQHYLKDRPVDENLDYAAVARATEGRSPADIAAMCNNAATKALKRKLRGEQPKITLDDMLT